MALPGVPNQFGKAESLMGLEKQKVKSQSYAPQMLGVRPVRAPALRLPIERPELGHSKLRYSGMSEPSAAAPKIHPFHVPTTPAPPHAAKMGRYTRLGKV